VGIGPMDEERLKVEFPKTEREEKGVMSKTEAKAKVGMIYKAMGMKEKGTRPEAEAGIVYKTLMYEGAMHKTLVEERTMSKIMKMMVSEAVMPKSTCQGGCTEGQRKEQNRY